MSSFLDSDDEDEFSDSYISPEEEKISQSDIIIISDSEIEVLDDDKDYDTDIVEVSSQVINRDMSDNETGITDSETGENGTGQNATDDSTNVEQNLSTPKSKFHLLTPSSNTKQSDRTNVSPLNEKAKQSYGRIFNSGGTGRLRSSKRLAKPVVIHSNQMKITDFKRTTMVKIAVDEKWLFDDDDNSLHDRFTRMEEAEQKYTDLTNQKEQKRLLRESEDRLIVDDLRKRCGENGLTVKNFNLLVSQVTDYYRKHGRNDLDPSDDINDETEEEEREGDQYKEIRRPIWGYRDFHIFNYLGDDSYQEWNKKEGTKLKEIDRRFEYWRYGHSRRVVSSSGLDLKEELAPAVVKYLHSSVKHEQDERILRESLNILIQNEEIKRNGGRSTLSLPRYLIQYLSNLLSEISGKENEEDESSKFELAMSNGVNESTRGLYQEIIPNFVLPTGKMIKIICCKMGAILKDNRDSITFDDILVCLKVILTCSADVNLDNMSIDIMTEPMIALFECVIDNGWHENIQIISETIFEFLGHYEVRYRILKHLKRCITTATRTEVSAIINNLHHRLCLSFFLNSTLNGYAIDTDDKENTTTTTTAPTENHTEEMSEGDIILTRHIIPHLEQETLFHTGVELKFLESKRIVREKSYEFSYLLEAITYQLPYLACKRENMTKSIINRERVSSYFQKGIERLRLRVNTEDMYTLFATLELCYSHIQGSYSVEVTMFSSAGKR